MEGTAINDKAPSMKYTWDGILDFLDEQERTIANTETERALERQELNSKIASLESELKSQENINRDLLKRIKMLEFSLKQEQIKNGKIMENPEAEIKNLNQFEVTESDPSLIQRHHLLSIFLSYGTYNHRRVNRDFRVVIFQESS